MSKGAALTRLQGVVVKERKRPHTFELAVVTASVSTFPKDIEYDVGVPMQVQLVRLRRYMVGRAVLK